MQELTSEIAMLGVLLFCQLCLLAIGTVLLAVTVFRKPSDTITLAELKRELARDEVSRTKSALNFD